MGTKQKLQINVYSRLCSSQYMDERINDEILGDALCFLIPNETEEVAKSRDCAFRSMDKLKSLEESSLVDMSLTPWSLLPLVSMSLDNSLHERSLVLVE